jgi:hypothetical protein
MAINFDALPKDKPNGNSTVTEGRHLAQVFKAEMTTSKEGNKYLRVTFKTKDGGFVNENYFDSDKPFLQYKLGRLLKATKVVLEGTGTLEDIAKVIRDKKVTIDVVVNDRGYGGLDYSDNKEGIYSRDEVVTEEIEVESPVDDEIEAAVASDEDDEF